MPLFYRIVFTSGLCCLIVGDFLQASPAHIPCPVIIVENFRPAVSTPNLKTWKLTPPPQRCPPRIVQSRLPVGPHKAGIPALLSHSSDLPSLQRWSTSTISGMLMRCLSERLPLKIGIYWPEPVSTRFIKLYDEFNNYKTNMPHKKEEPPPPQHFLK